MNHHIQGTWFEAGDILSLWNFHLPGDSFNGKKKHTAHQKLPISEDLKPPKIMAFKWEITRFYFSRFVDVETIWIFFLKLIVFFEMKEWKMS